MWNLWTSICQHFSSPVGRLPKNHKIQMRWTSSSLLCDATARCHTSGERVCRNSSGIISWKQPWPRRHTQRRSIYLDKCRRCGRGRPDEPWLSAPGKRHRSASRSLCLPEVVECRKVCLPETLPPLHLSRADKLVVSKRALRGDALSIRMRRGEY